MGFAETMHFYLTESADPRTNNWFLIGSPIPLFIIIFSYLYFVLKCGPDFMKNRPPYSLKTFIRLYNGLQIIANAWVVKSVLEAGWSTDLTIFCVPLRYTYEPGPYKLAHVMWWVTLIKILDFVETGVFVLRKKFNQVSTLHLYHHISTVLVQWLGTKYISGTMSTFVVMVNCGVHVVMYSYYLLSTWPNIAKMIGSFKRYITLLQIVQLFLLAAYVTQTLSPSCPVPKFPALVFLPNVAMNIYLFLNFYRKAYGDKSKKKVK